MLVASSTKHTVFGLAVGASTAWVTTMLWLAHDAFNGYLMGVILANKAGGVSGVVEGLCLSFFAWPVPVDGKKSRDPDLVFDS